MGQIKAIEAMHPGFGYNEKGERFRVTDYTVQDDAVQALLRVQFIPQRAAGFTAFLRRFRGIDHRLGDLAADVDSDPEWPKQATNFHTFYRYMEYRNWPSGSIDSLAIAWCQYAINEWEGEDGSAVYKALIPADVRWAVWERDNFTCLSCGTRRDLSVDHVLAESKGGAMTLDNLQTLCRSCNSRKGAR